jgi:methyl-accepting chemotaxis protein
MNRYFSTPLFSIKNLIAVLVGISMLGTAALYFVASSGNEWVIESQRKGSDSLMMESSVKQLYRYMTESLVRINILSVADSLEVIKELGNRDALDEMLVDNIQAIRKSAGDNADIISKLDVIHRYADEFIVQEKRLSDAAVAVITARKLEAEAVEKAHVLGRKGQQLSGKILGINTFENGKAKRKLKRLLKNSQDQVIGFSFGDTALYKDLVSGFSGKSASISSSMQLSAAFSDLLLLLGEVIEASTHDELINLKGNKVNQLLQRLNKLLASMTEEFSEHEKIGFLIDELKMVFIKFSAHLSGTKGSVMQLRREMLNSAQEEQLISTEVRHITDKMRGVLDRLSLINQEVSQQTSEAASTAIQRSQLWINLVILAFMVVVTALGILIFYWISRPLAMVTSAMKAINSGEADLTNRLPIPRINELKVLSSSFNGFLSTLQNTMSTVQVNASDLDNLTHQLTSENQSLAQRTEQQSASLLSTSELLGQVSEQVIEAQHAAENALMSSSQADEHVKKGKQRLSQTVMAMQNIEESSSKILGVNTLIDSIAFEINLLALNAAVEAARAGEQGTGFAVVANQVRILAGRSADAANEIKELINETVERIQKGGETLDQTGESLQCVLDAVKDIDRKVVCIQDVTEKQRQGVNQINDAMLEVNSATQKNVELVEITAEASANIDSGTTTIREMVSSFKTSSVAA